MVSSALNRLAPIDFTRYIDRLTERFTGREWLFEQIDRWLKQGNEQFYLLTGEPGVGKSAIAAKLTQIRSDIAAYHFCRAGDVETVRPGRVLRSLAAQLGKTLPRYGEALAKTIDPIHLRIDVNINIESLSNSQVTGIYIENLKESDPRDELEILLRAPLAALPDLYAEHNEPLPTLKILLIDSLDEAVTTTGRDNMATLLAALSQADGLPSWIRFILTARRGIENSLQFKSLQLYKLEELLAQNLEDIERYVQSRVEELVVQPELKFQARLEQAELSAETLVREVKELSKGNFLYTRLLMDGIGTGELSVKNLSILPKTLNEVYQRFLRHRCPFRKWSDRYQPILGTLTVTQEAISQEQLAKFTGIDARQIGKALGVLQQFLDEVDDEQGQQLYSIFHQSLREYLLDRKYNHDFWCDDKEQHDNIIECCEKESKEWHDLRAIDLYGLRHLAQHLVKGDRVEDLHNLLGLEKDESNAWFEAKESISDVAGFLSDIKLACEYIEQEFEKDKIKTIERQFYYVLIQSSLKSSS
ncbi:MAG TPA: ATP-binding protein [Leptolyngbyaceae cyanobacterium]